MKKLTFLFITLLLTTMSWAVQTNAEDDDGTSLPSDSCLVVWHKDGSKVSFNLNETPKITYSGDKVIIQSSTAVEYDFRAIRKMTYSMNDALTGIRTLSVDGDKPFIKQGQTLTFMPADKDMNVRIVTLSGMVLNNFVVRRGQPVSLSLVSSSAKVYLIQVNGVTYKISSR